MKSAVLCALALSATLLATTPAMAQTPTDPVVSPAPDLTDIIDLVGARAAGAETAMQRRGYVLSRGQQGDDRVYTYWWNQTRGACVVVATMNGRYDSITATTKPDCESPTAQRNVETSDRAENGAVPGAPRMPTGDCRRPAKKTKSHGEH